MRFSKKWLAGLAALAGLLVAAPMVVAQGEPEACGAAGAPPLEVVGLTDDGTLICFPAPRPDREREIGQVTGLAGDTELEGIDYRPATGELIGVGNQGGIYSIDDETAVATKKSQLSVALSGSSFGVDFNPTVDRLRIISDDGQNLRANVDTGATIVDTPLNYPGGANPATGVTGAAYTNNDADPDTATTLYDIDSNLDQVVVQSPANSGQLAATGKLRVDTSPIVGFDIHSSLRRGSTVFNEAVASLTVGGESRFYRVDLTTGRTFAGRSFDQDDDVTAIAVPLDQR